MAADGARLSPSSSVVGHDSHDFGPQRTVGRSRMFMRPPLLWASIRFRRDPSAMRRHASRNWMFCALHTMRLREGLVGTESAVDG